MRDIRWLAARVIAWVICWTAAALLAPPLGAQEFPVIFNSATKLRPLGISVDFGERVPPLKNKCFHYGETAYRVSTSDEFYDRFKRRGFSVAAMCLGLVSETRYDPETGRRLPTYILTDPALAKANKREFKRMVEEGAISSELPLDLPDCFKNGNPYSDCQFRFGRMTGKPLTAAQTDAYKQLGAAIDKVMSAQIRGISGEEKFIGEEGGLRGYRDTSGHVYIHLIDAATPEELLRYSSASFWVRSSKLARGYGYALDADGGAGPSVNPAAVKAATEQQSKPQIDPARLRQILNSNRP